MNTEFIKAPFPYFGGKSKAAPLVWPRFGDVKNYVEPFAGSAAMLLAAPEGDRIETINDKDGFIANFWRAVAYDPEAVAHHADWPVSEIDLVARHAWLVNRTERLKWSLEDPDFYDAKTAGWWVWGACAWIGSGWCSGKGPHIGNGAHVVDSRVAPAIGQGINRQLQHLGDGGKGINRQLQHLGVGGKCINRQLQHLGTGGQGINRQLIESMTRREFITTWMRELSDRMRDVRVTCGDWRRVLGRSPTEKLGITGIFLDPPYTKGDMDYAVGGVGGELADAVRAWCLENGSNPMLRIALCGHDGEHNELEGLGWLREVWKAGSGYARSDEAVENRKSESIWFSPACDVPPDMNHNLFCFSEDGEE